MKCISYLLHPSFKSLHLKAILSYYFKPGYPEHHWFHLNTHIYSAIMKITSECLHLFLYTSMHAEVKHKIYVLLCIIHCDSLQKQHTNTIRLHSAVELLLRFLNVGSFLTSSSPPGFRSTAVNPYTLDEGQNWKFKLQNRETVTNWKQVCYCFCKYTRFMNCNLPSPSTSKHCL